mgnify:CR=1 FL=1
MDMYTEIILDYYEYPRNFGTIDNAQIKSKDFNPICGDEIEMHILLEGEIIKEIKYSGHGCAISQASASMVTERLVGKNIKSVIELNRNDVLEMLGIEVSPARLKCAMLGLKVVKLGAYSHMGMDGDSTDG